MSGCLPYCGVSSCWYSMPRSFHSLWYSNSIISSSFINWNIFMMKCYDSYTIWTPSNSVYIGKDRINTCFLPCIYHLSWVIIHIPYISPTECIELSSFLVYINFRNFHYPKKKPHILWLSLPTLHPNLFWAFSINGIIRYVFLCDWPLSLSTCFQGSSLL